MILQVCKWQYNKYCKNSFTSNLLWIFLKFAKLYGVKCKVRKLKDIPSNLGSIYKEIDL